MSGFPRQATGSWDSDFVLRLDLRPPEAIRRLQDDRREPGLRPVAQLQRQATMVLVIVRSADLGQIQETLFDIAADQRMRVICLVIGQPPEGVSHPALRIPGSLGTAGVASLWVSDDEGRGCGWWIDSDAPLIASEKVLGDSTELPLDLLDDCLQIPDVFKGVLAEVEQMGGHVASPGLIAFGGRLAARDLLAARIRAVRAVTGDPGTAAAEGPRPATPPGRTVSPGGQAAQYLLPQSPAAQTRTAADAMVAECERLRRGALRLLLPQRDGRHPGAVVADAHAAVRQYQRALARLFTAAHQPGTRLDEPAVARVREAGVATDQIDWLAPDELLDKLREATQQRIRTSSLEAVRLWLRLSADAATPRGSGDYVRTLAALDTPAGPSPAFLLRARPTWLLVLLGVAATAAGIAGPAGVAVGVAVLVAVLYLLARRPAGAELIGWVGSAGEVARAHLPVMAAGLAAGLAVRHFVAIPAPVGTYAPVAAAVLAGGALVAWWTRAAQAWLEQVDVGGPRRAERRLDDVLHRAVTEEWRTASARAHVADAALAGAAALDSIAAVLRRHETELAAGRMRDRDPANAGGSGDDVLDDIIATDLRDAVESALDGVWGQARAGSPAGSWDLAADRMAEHLTEYENHLTAHDINDPPPFARSGRRRARTLSAWGPPPQLADLLQTPADGPLVQLCRDRHISLLSLNRIRSVRFAPAAMKDLVSQELARRSGGPLLAEMHWTTTGSLAGVLRLLAPRVGVVEMTWPSEDAEFTWSEEENDDA